MVSRRRSVSPLAPRRQATICTRRSTLRSCSQPRSTRCAAIVEIDETDHQPATTQVARRNRAPGSEPPAGVHSQSDAPSWELTSSLVRMERICSAPWPSTRTTPLRGLADRPSSAREHLPLVPVSRSNAPAVALACRCSRRSAAGPRARTCPGHPRALPPPSSPDEVHRRRLVHDAVRPHLHALAKPPDCALRDDHYRCPELPQPCTMAERSGPRQEEVDEATSVGTSVRVAHAARSSRNGARPRSPRPKRDRDAVREEVVVLDEQTLIVMDGPPLVVEPP